MSYWKILISFLLLALGQGLVWFQMYGSTRWINFGLGGKHLFVTILAGMPITYLFMVAAKFGIEGFGESWPVRIMTFAAGIVVFAIMTSVFLGEGMSIKTWISLGLMATIIGVQVFMK